MSYILATNTTKKVLPDGNSIRKGSLGKILFLRKALSDNKIIMFIVNNIIFGLRRLALKSNHCNVKLICLSFYMN